MTIEELAQRLEQFADPDSVERAAAILRILAIYHAAHEDFSARVIKGCPLHVQHQLAHRIAALSLSVNEAYDIHLK